MIRYTHSFAHIHICTYMFIYMHKRYIRTIESSFGNSWSHFTTRDEMNNAHTHHQHKKRFHAAAAAVAAPKRGNNNNNTRPSLSNFTSIVRVGRRRRRRRHHIDVIASGGRMYLFLVVVFIVRRAAAAAAPSRQRPGRVSRKVYFHARAAHILLSLNSGDDLIAVYVVLCRMCVCTAHFSKANLKIHIKNGMRFMRASIIFSSFGAVGINLRIRAVYT